MRCDGHKNVPLIEIIERGEAADALSGTTDAIGQGWK
jgi:hypothetical protein